MDTKNEKAVYLKLQISTLNPYFRMLIDSHLLSIGHTISLLAIITAQEKFILYLHFQYFYLYFQCINSLSHLFHSCHSHFVHSISINRFIFYSLFLLL